MTCVVDAVTSELVIVNVRSAAAAMLTEVNMAWPARALMTIGDAAAPVAVVALNNKPFPAAELTKFPLVAVILPRVAVILVPAVTVVAAPTDPSVEVMLPAEATILPVVAVIPVPAVTVVPEAIVVVDVIDPGAVNAAGMLKVIVLAAPVDVIWLAVPNRLKFPAVGDRAPPDPPVNVTIPPTAPVPNAIQVPAGSPANR